MAKQTNKNQYFKRQQRTEEKKNSYRGTVTAKTAPTETRNNTGLSLKSESPPNSIHVHHSTHSNTHNKYNNSFKKTIEKE